MSDQIKEYLYQTSGQGVCCSEIKVQVEADTVKDVEFVGGCPGNHLGIRALVRGRKIAEVIQLLSGLPCHDRPTSCPDQLARALQNSFQN